MCIAKLIFYTTLIGVLYYFILYPFTLWLIVLLKNEQKQDQSILDQGYLPSVSFIISVYNEEAIIKDKLKNTLQLTYPEEKLEVLVVSDASTDSTDEIVKDYPDERVKLVRQPERLGKTEALNFALESANAECVVFTDANSMYEQDALNYLLGHFSNPRVGFVTGTTRYITTEDNTLGQSTNIYSKLEGLLKDLESRIGYCVGADGAIFAIRKKLYRPLKSWDINDLVIPLNIIEQGYMGLQDNRAICREQSVQDKEREFDRQVRITNRTLRAIFNNKHLLNPFHYPLFSFLLFSHKLIKFALPFFLFLLLISNLFLLTQGAFYIITFAGQICFYALAITHSKAREESFLGSNRLAGAVHSFCIVVLAYLYGWWKLLTGETYSVWKPSGSENY